MVGQEISPGVNKFFATKPIGEHQYCSNNVANPGAPYFTFINPVVRNKLGSDSAVCTSTGSYCRLSLGQQAQVR